MKRKLFTFKKWLTFDNQINYLLYFFTQTKNLKMFNDHGLYKFK